MYESHTPRAAGKFVALLASLTMIVAGLVGVALAAPASAAAQEVCSGYDSGKIDTTGDPKSVVVTAPAGQLIDGYCVKAGSDVSVPGGAVVWVPVSPPAASVTITHPSGKAVSHYALSYTDVPREYTYSKQVTITKTICTAEGTIVGATATGENITASRTGSDFTAEEKAAIDAQATASANAAFNAKYPSYTEGACAGDYTYSKQVTITKTICTAEGTIVGATATGENITASRTGSDFTAEEKAAFDAQAAASANAAFNAKYPSYTEGACGGGGEPFRATASVSGSEQVCFNDQNVTVEAAGSGAGESTESQAAAQALADANANADLTAKMAAAKAGYPNATAGTCPVASTVTPLPATVAPAKRPAKVVLPATVPAGVVSVPSAATLPAAVPAGDGSQAPGLPMWALALIAAGAIGAAAAGKQVLAARK